MSDDISTRRFDDSLTSEQRAGAQTDRQVGAPDKQEECSTGTSRAGTCRTGVCSPCLLVWGAFGLYLVMMALMEMF